MSTNKNDVFDRNLENLIRASVLPSREEQARAEFLNRAAAKPAARPEGGRVLAMAASFLAGAIVIWSMMPSEAPVDAALGVREAAPGPRLEEAGAPEVVVQDGESTLSVKPSSWTQPRPGFRVKGKVPAEDGTVLNVVFARLEETFVAGRLVSQEGQSTSGRVQVLSNKFAVELPGDLGPYQAKILDVEGPGPMRRWTFKVHVSGKRFEERLTRDFDEAVRLGREARRLVSAFDAACVSQAAWQAAKVRLEEKARRLIAVLQQVESRTLCAVSIREARSTIGLIVGSISSFVWEDGKLKVRSYYRNGEEILTQHGENFAFKNFGRYVDDAIALAGREALLCVIRELKNGRSLDAPLETLLDKIGRDNGLTPFVTPLLEAEPDLVAIEKSVREGKIEGGK